MDGNCQISSTLYNAVLAVPSLVVTERHAHSNKVPYIQYLEMMLAMMLKYWLLPMELMLQQL